MRVGRWEGDLWARQAAGVGGLYIDDHADDRQMEALPAIIGGRAGGFPGWVNECFAGGRQSRGIERAKISYEIAPDLGHWGVEIVGKIKAWAKAISGPTSPPGKYPQLINAPGSERGPGPQLVTWGKSTILSVDAHGFKFEYTLNSAKHIPFDWERSRTDRAPSLGADPTCSNKNEIVIFGKQSNNGRLRRPQLAALHNAGSIDMLALTAAPEFLNLPAKPCASHCLGRQHPNAIKLNSGEASDVRLDDRPGVARHHDGCLGALPSSLGAAVPAGFCKARTSSITSLARRSLRPFHRLV